MTRSWSQYGTDLGDPLLEFEPDGMVLRFEQLRSTTSKVEKVEPLAITSCQESQTIEPFDWSTLSPAPVLTQEQMLDELQYDYAWHDSDILKTRISNKGWFNSEIPAILESLPTNLVISKQLADIISWSLLRPSAFATLLKGKSKVDETVRICDNNVGEIESASEAATLGHAPGETLTEPTRQDSFSKLLRTQSKKAEKSGLVTRLNTVRKNVSTKTEAIPETIQVEPEPLSNGECISCFDELEDSQLVTLPCNHRYCKPCLREMVTNAMKTESAFPPKCCLTEMPLKQVLVCLETKSLRKQYQAKAAEYSIPAGHRWYCPNTDCTKWIPPEKLKTDRNNRQTCPHCRTSICSHCRGVVHPNNEECPEDFGLNATLEVAGYEGWQRCYSCRTMVELTVGCIHMRCRCGAEFCYVCLARWHTCRCTEADMERRRGELRNRRAERDQREAEDNAAAQAEADEIAEAIRQVEEMEAREAVERAEREERKRLEEELALARLEEERLLEEIAKREAEEEEERQLWAAMKHTCEEELGSLSVMLSQILEYQQASMTSKHEVDEQILHSQNEEAICKLRVKNEEMLGDLRKNVKKRAERVERQQAKEWDLFWEKAEEDEDKAFERMQEYLRDKPNREVREEKMRHTLQQKRQDDKKRLEMKQHQDRKQFRGGYQCEREALKLSLESLITVAQDEQTTGLNEFGNMIGRERHWFELVTTRRLAMLATHKHIMHTQLENKDEPAGLTLEHAALISPQILDSAGAQVLTEADDAVHEDEESTDMFGSGSPISPLSDSRPISSLTEISAPTRSNTVIRTMPGSFPVAVAQLSQAFEDNTVTASSSTATVTTAPAEQAETTVAPVYISAITAAIASAIEIPPTPSLSDTPTTTPSSSAHNSTEYHGAVLTPVTSSGLTTLGPINSVGDKKQNKLGGFLKKTFKGKEKEDTTTVWAREAIQAPRTIPSRPSAMANKTFRTSYYF